MAFIAYLAQDTAAAKNVKPRTLWMNHWKNRNSLSCLTCSCAISIYGSEVIATGGSSPSGSLSPVEHSSFCVCPKDQHKKTFLVIQNEWGQGEFKDSYLIILSHWCHPATNYWIPNGRSKDARECVWTHDTYRGPTKFNFSESKPPHLLLPCCTQPTLKLCQVLFSTLWSRELGRFLPTGHFCLFLLHRGISLFYQVRWWWLLRRSWPHGQGRASCAPCVCLC